MPWRCSGICASIRKRVGSGVGAQTTASTVKWRPISIVGGTVRNSTVTSDDSRRRLGSNPRGGSHTCEASTETVVSAIPSNARKTTRPLTLPSPSPGARVLSTAILERIAEEDLGVLPRDALGDVRRKIREPRARPGRVLRHVVPALRDDRVGTHHEAVGNLEEDRAPLRRYLPIGTVVAARREIGPQRLVLAQHVAHLLGRIEAGMRPEDSRGGILLEEAFDGFGVRVGVQDELVLLGELHDTLRHREIGVCSVHVELADRNVPVLAQPLLEIGNDCLVPYPRRQISSLPIRPERRDDDVGGFGEELLRALVARARHQRPLEARFAEEGHGLFRRHHRPRVVTVVDVGVDHRQLGGPADSRHHEHEHEREELAHTGTSLAPDSTATERVLAPRLDSRIIRAIPDLCSGAAHRSSDASVATATIEERAMKPPRFDYVAPKSLDEALTSLAQHGASAKILAGGQSLIPLLNFRLSHPEVLIDINRIADLAYDRVRDDDLAIGALTRQHAVERSDAVKTRVPILTEACRLIGHATIRHRGTIGGNLADADPASEPAAGVVAHGAETD